MRLPGAKSNEKLCVMDQTPDHSSGDDGAANAAESRASGRRAGYILDNQVGFLLRKAQQRHLSIFSAHMSENLTSQQFAALSKLWEVGPCSQNSLGRQTGMDNSTINGVVRRLGGRGLLTRAPLPGDERMLRISLTDEGRRCIERVIPMAREITRMTLAPLSREERTTLIRLLRRIT